MRGSRLALLLLVLPLLASCEGIFLPRACTLIGCTDGLSVQLVGLPAGPYTLEAQLPGGEVRTFECAQAEYCPVAFFPEVRAEEVTLRLTTASGTHSETQRAVYTRHRPNGRGCAPVCRQATLTMRVPE